MKRLLFITCRLPFPLDDGWKIRTFNILKGLARSGYVIDLATFVRDEREKKHIEALAPYCHDVCTVVRAGGYKPAALLWGVFSSLPFSVFNYREEEMARAVARLAAKKAYDLVQIEDVVMAQYLPAGHRGGKILDMHNVESHLLARYAAHERNPLKKFYAGLTAQKLRRYEAAVSGSFDAVTVCSAEDRGILARNGVASPIVVVPNGVDCAYYGEATEMAKAGEDRIVFVGSMDYHANISAALFFVRDIFPHILARHPQGVLYIVGKNPPAEILALAGPHVVVTGAVVDVRPYVASAKVVVAPLLVGGGTRLKILEAMAMGKPVVSTPVGCEGIEVTDRENIYIEKEPLRFAETIMRLLADEGERRLVGETARRFVQSRYDWTIITQTMHERMGEWVNG